MLNQNTSNSSTMLKHLWFSCLDYYKFCVNYGFKRVPEIDGFDLSKMTMEDIIAFADGKSKINKNTMREGIVVRDDTVSFKVISNKFLLKYD